MRILVLFSALLFLSFSCGTTRHASGKGDQKTEVISILHGTSFGHCRGYCIKEELYTADAMVYTQYNRDSLNFPKKEVKEAFTAEAFQELVNAIDWEKWEALPEVIGCPDCADAGAEYIQITTSKGSKRVLFDAYSDPEGLVKLLDAIRVKRRQLERDEKNAE